MKHLSSLLLLLLLCIACTSKNSIPEYSHPFPVETIAIDPELSKESMKRKITPNDMHHSFWVKLETSPQCLIGRIGQLQLFRDRIYILDQQKANSLYVFDIKGNFLFQPGRPGKGPGEYYKASHFSIDSVENCIVIIDSEMKKAHRYNLESGKHLKSTQLDNSHYIRAGIAFDSVSYAFDQILINPRKGKQQFHLLFIRNDSVIGFKPLLRDHHLRTPNPFCVTNQTIYYNPIRCDTIFEINKQGVKRGIYIDFGKYAIPRDFPYAKGVEMQAEQLQKSKYVIHISNVLETPNHFYFSYKCNGWERTVLMNKHTKTIYKDLRYAYFMPYIFIGSYGEYLIAAEYDFAENWNKGSAEFKAFIDSIQSPEHREIVKDTQEGDNPILHFVDLNL